MILFYYCLAFDKLVYSRNLTRIFIGSIRVTNDAKFPRVDNEDTD